VELAQPPVAYGFPQGATVHSQYMSPGSSQSSGTPFLLTSDDEPVEMSVGSITFPGEGPYSLELYVSPACGPERLVATSGFTVLDDEDNDGLSRDVELDMGTDPSDADTDDDGLLDGADGLDDSDGDGVIDALDCDSDDDGLMDGLEAGVSEPHADTFASPCLVLDAAPESVTDPDDPDTDGGGVSDGEEDENKNGRMDFAERDPNAELDDGIPCSTLVPPEVTNLRLGKEGADVRLTWSALWDRCTTYRILVGDTAPGLGLIVDGLEQSIHLDSTPLGPSRILYYVTAADSVLGGPGPTGR
jgi:hypothetical protein